MCQYARLCCYTSYFFCFEFFKGGSGSDPLVLEMVAAIAHTVDVSPLFVFFETVVCDAVSLFFFFVREMMTCAGTSERGQECSGTSLASHKPTVEIVRRRERRPGGGGDRGSGLCGQNCCRP